MSGCFAHGDSPVASAVLEYLVRTVPGVNKSAVCADAIERALQDAYPDLWATVCERAAAEPHRKKTYNRPPISP
jgi:hypothetical protein